jgi:hypothetical protein
MPTPDGPQFDNYANRFRSESTSYQENPNLSSTFGSTMSGTPLPVTKHVQETHIPGNSRYEFIADNAKDLGAYVEVRHTPGSITTMYPYNYKYTDDWAKYTAEGESRGSGQIPLFKQHQRLPGSYVSEMRSTKGNRLDAMNLLGAAAVDTVNTRERELKPSGSLSRYSHALVSGLEEAGVTQMPEDLRSNDWDFYNSMGEPWGGRASTARSSIMDKDAVRSGVRLIRNVARMRGDKKRLKKDQFEQLQLDLK